MPTALLRRFFGEPDGSTVSRRVEVCPPALVAGASAGAPGWRAGLRDWLETGWSRPSGRGCTIESTSAAEGGGALGAVRTEFLQSLDDIRTQQVGVLQQRIGRARNLRDLWHLRPEVFKLVALHYSQAEAQSRLDRLNRHFPTRSPRSGFAPL